MTLTRRQISALLTDHGLAPKRSLGQNFVADANTVRRIARLAGVGPGDRVVEIGAGLGSLTLALADAGAAVTAVEVDRGLVPLLRTVVPASVQVVEADAMRLDWGALLGGGPWTLVANLPYNVATPLVVTLLETVPAIERMLVMVQAEVGERMAAAAGADAYGAVSALIGYWATAAVVGRVPASVFVPRPNVESVLVSVVRHPPAVEVPYPRFKEVVRAGFAHRRKMLRSSLAGVVEPSSFLSSGVPPTARAEELDVAAWGPAVVVKAYAKLTLSLRVTGVRADGYHLLDAEMVSLDLADELTFSAGDSLTVSGPFPVDAGDDNLVRRALVAAGLSAAVHLMKRIPAGAGLGGGSADAAAVLRWAGREDDVELAASLGADVPFCLRGGRARVQGVGEVLTPLPCSAGSPYTLLTPPIHVPTAAVYRRWDDLGAPSGDGLNDLEPAALAVAPSLAVWRDRLGEATGVIPVLAGSGSTWWVQGAFPDVPGVMVAHTVCP